MVLFLLARTATGRGASIFVRVESVHRAAYEIVEFFELQGVMLRFERREHCKTWSFQIDRVLAELTTERHLRKIKSRRIVCFELDFMHAQIQLQRLQSSFASDVLAALNLAFPRFRDQLQFITLATTSTTSHVVK